FSALYRNFQSTRNPYTETQIKFLPSPHLFLANIRRICRDQAKVDPPPLPNTDIRRRVGSTYRFYKARKCRDPIQIQRKKLLNQRREYAEMAKREHKELLRQQQFKQRAEKAN
ncbi:MAG: hypothetical protein L6R36_008268, partial [Xanthoria steineri]